MAAAVLGAALVTQGVTPNPARAKRATISQPPQLRQVLVVTANLAEAWDPSDNADSSDMVAFVKRVTSLTPHAPDVLLLQEVTRSSTAKVVRLLSRRTSERYRVAVSAGKDPVEVRGDHVRTRETSIVFNARRMKMISEPHLINTTHQGRHGSTGRLREVKRNAAAMLEERGSGMRIPVASVHFHTTAQLRSKKIARRYRTVWSKQIARTLGRKWPNVRGNAIIGGDFNAARTRWTDGRHVIQRWWRSLTSRRFKDSVRLVDPHGGVDYIFSRTRIAAARVDRSYDRKKAAGTSTYYSDHKLRWALLGRWQPRVRVKSTSSTAVGLTWAPLPGAKEVRVLRSRPGSGRWSLTARARGRAGGVFDRRLEPASRYVYRVVAWNGAERSTPSRVLRVRTEPDTSPPVKPPAPRISLKVKPVDQDLEVQEKPLAIRLNWKRAKDRGGSGGVVYEVWRRELGRDPVLIKETTKRRYLDRRFTKRRTVEYFVVAFDAVGNRSDRSDAATVVPVIEAY